MSKKISTTVTDAFHEELAAYCHALGDMPLSAFARYAMQQYMNRHPKKVYKNIHFRENDVERDKSAKTDT